MKTPIVVLSLVLSFSAALLAQPAPPVSGGQAPGTPRVMDPAIRAKLLARTGGILQTSATGPSFLFLNAQKRVSVQALRETEDQIQKILRLPCVSVSKPSAEPVAAAVTALADTNTAMVIVICDESGYPSLLIAPESRWALVNVAALGGSGVPADKLAERTQKEIWRALGLVMGAANSTAEQCLMKTVLSAADLDTLTAKCLSTEAFSKIIAQAQKMGMKPTRMTTYRKAVEEGWAPAPTNDVQRAIWNELKK